MGQSLSRWSRSVNDGVVSRSEQMVLRGACGLWCRSWAITGAAVGCINACACIVSSICGHASAVTFGRVDAGVRRLDLHLPASFAFNLKRQIQNPGRWCNIRTTCESHSRRSVQDLRATKRRARPQMSSSSNNNDSHAATPHELGEQWKSALCVTSLYDTYLALQRENATLRGELEHLRQETALATAKQAALRDPEVEDGPEQEVRLLQTEKLQLTARFEKSKAQLQRQLDEYKALYAQQLHKYQQKYAVDPHEDKRVAISVKSLQDALEKTSQQKDELAMRYQRLQQMHHELEAAHGRLQEALAQHEAELAQKKSQHTHRLLRQVLERWVLGRTSRAWKQWTMVVMAYRLEGKRQQEVAQLTSESNAQLERIRAHKAALIAAKWLQSSVRCTFSAWRDHVLCKRVRQQKVDVMNNKLAIGQTQRVMKAWKARTKETICQVRAALKVLRLIRAHKLRSGWQLWTRHAADNVVQRLANANAQLQSQVVMLSAQVGELSKQADELTREREEIEQQLETQTNQHDCLLDQKAVMRQLLLNRLGGFFRKQNDRVLVGQILQTWRQVTTVSKVLADRSARLKALAQRKRLTRTVRSWFVATEYKRRYRRAASRCIMRMRQLNVLKCFNAWKETYLCGRERRLTLRRVVSHMKHQSLMRCFRRWNEFKDEKLEMRQAFERGLLCLSKLYLGIIFRRLKQSVRSMEQEFADRQRQEIEKEWQQRLEESKFELQIQLHCFARWSAVVQSNRNVERFVRKYSVLRQLRAMQMCWKAWLQFRYDRLHQRKVMTRILHRRSRVIIKDAWARMVLAGTTLARDAKLQCVLDEKQRVCNQLQMELERVRKLYVTAQADGDALRSQLSTTIDRLERRIAHLSQREQALTSTLSTVVAMRDVEHAKQKILHSWQAVARQRKRQRLIIMAFQDKCVYSKAKLVWAAWAAIMRRRVSLQSSMNLFRHHERQNLQRLCLTSWNQVVARSKQIETWAEQFARRLQTLTLLRAWNTWRRCAQCNSLLRNVVKQIWLSSVHCRMRQCFNQWVHLNQEEARKERNVQHQAKIRAFQAQICWKWSRCSLHSVFVVWKARAHLRRRVEKFQVRLRTKQRARLKLACLDEWKIWVACWNETKVKLRRVIACSVKSAMQMALVRWKDLVLHFQRDTIQRLTLATIKHEEDLRSKSEELTIKTSVIRELEKNWEDVYAMYEQCTVIEQHMRSTVLLLKTLRAWIEFTRRARTAKCREATARQHARNKLGYRCFRLWERWLRTKNRLLEIAEIHFGQYRRDQTMGVFKRWAHITRAACALRRKYQQVRERQLRTLISRSFAMWTTAMQRLRGLNQMWKRNTHLLALRDTQAHEKQKQIWRFLLGKDESRKRAAITRWYALLMHRKAVATHFVTIENARRSKKMRVAWAAWQQMIVLGRTARASLITLLEKRRRACLREAVVFWRTHLLKVQIQSLTFQNRTLEEEMRRTAEILANEKSVVTELSTIIESKEDEFRIYQEERSRLEHSITHKLDSATLQNERATALNKIIIRRCVLRSVVSAFLQWKSITALHCRRDETCWRLSQIASRSVKRAHWQIWKRRLVMTSRYEHLQRRASQIQLGQRWCTWKSFTRNRKHTRQLLQAQVVRVGQRQQIACARLFFQWTDHTRRGRTKERVENMEDAIEKHQNTERQRTRLLLLSKWCWRVYHRRLQQMRTFLSRCSALWVAQLEARHQHELQMLANKTRELTTALSVEEARSKQLSNRLTVQELQEELVKRTMLGVQTLMRRISQVAHIKDLFQTISSTFSQVISGSSAVLFLLDPSRNEVWTLLDHSKPLQLPSTVGILGYALSSSSSVLVINAPTDPRFHPMVDQYVLSAMRADSTSLGYSAGSAVGKASDRPIAIFATAVVAPDGGVYGVLQVAFHMDTLSTGNLPMLDTQVHLYARVCAFYVETLFYDMLKHCKDRTRAREPDRFSKLFKQNKGWRKHYVELERKLTTAETKARLLAEEESRLVQEKSKLEAAIDRLQRKDQEAVATAAAAQAAVQHVAHYKRKIAKLKLHLQQKDAELAAKIDELKQVSDQCSRLRQAQRTHEYQAKLVAAARSPRPQKLSGKESLRETDHLLRADNATLKNQLVRAESDNQILVTAVDLAVHQHGHLPDALQHEVRRISRRLKETRAS